MLGTPWSSIEFYHVYYLSPTSILLHHESRDVVIHFYGICLTGYEIATQIDVLLKVAVYRRTSDSSGTLRSHFDVYRVTFPLCGYIMESRTAVFESPFDINDNLWRK